MFIEIKKSKYLFNSELRHHNTNQDAPVFSGASSSGIRILFCLSFGVHFKSTGGFLLSIQFQKHLTTVRCTHISQPLYAPFTMRLAEANSFDVKSINRPKHFKAKMPMT